MRSLKLFFGASLIVALGSGGAMLLGWYSPTASEETQLAMALLYGFYGFSVTAPLVVIAIVMLEAKFRRDERAAEQQRQNAIAAASREYLLRNPGFQPPEESTAETSR